MGLQALMNVGYALIIKYKLINCSWIVVGWMPVVEKVHISFKKSPSEFSDYEPALHFRNW